MYKHDHRTVYFFVINIAPKKDMQTDGYFCALCDKSFTTASNLNKHWNTLIHKNLSEGRSVSSEISSAWAIVDRTFKEDDFNAELGKGSLGPFVAYDRGGQNPPFYGCYIVDDIIYRPKLADIPALTPKSHDPSNMVFGFIDHIEYN